MSCAQKRNNLEYSMASKFLPDVPKRREGVMQGLSGEVFSRFVLSNTCPGACFRCHWGLVRRPGLHATPSHASGP